MDQHDDEAPDAEVIAADGGSARTDAQRPPVPNAAPSGAQPSNTAPDKCTEQVKSLRWGIDSLYLSYPGQLSDEWFRKLEDCKINAQSDDPHERTLAQVNIGGHLFEVSDHGKRRFPYILADNCFFIQVSSRAASRVPLVHAQISSEYLAAAGWEKAEAQLRIVANTLGKDTGDAQISRIDLFVDFTCSGFDADFDQAAWVTRAERVAKYYRRPYFSGWAVGQGGVISSRMYDKTLEVEQHSHKTWLYELWEAVGWKAPDTVLRQEFQLRREALKQLGVTSPDGLMTDQASLWRYLSTDWLRLTLPSLTDATQSRWPTHPLWAGLQRTFETGEDSPRLTRFTASRLPSDDFLFKNGVAGLTSFMAKHGITDFGEGVGEYLHSLERFHGEGDREGLGPYIQKKVREKGKRYNTITNIKPQDERAVANQAEEYRKTRDGN